MAHKKAKGQQAEKLFLGSLRASRAIKKVQENKNSLLKNGFDPIVIQKPRGHRIGGALSTPIQTWLFSLFGNPPSFVMVRY